MTEIKGDSMTEPVAFTHWCNKCGWAGKQKWHTGCSYFAAPLNWQNPAPAPASLRDMTEADFDKAHGIAPAGVPDVEPIAWCVRYDGPPSYDGIHSNPTMHKPEAEALAARAGLVLVELVPVTALAALQSHSKAIDAEYAFARTRLLALAGEIATKERENAQQAERSKELKAELDAAPEKESERWAERFNFLHTEYGSDCSGTDSGDLLDLVEAEVRQALQKVEAERDAALKDAERVRVHVFEFINDWRKGDFALPELAQYDVMAIIETYKAIDAAREG